MEKVSRKNPQHQNEISFLSAFIFYKMDQQVFCKNRYIFTTSTKTYINRKLIKNSKIENIGS